jgi:hypothetical protein
MVAGSADSHSGGGHHAAHGSAGKGAAAYPDRYPNACEFRIPGTLSYEISIAVVHLSLLHC